nr:AbgT family transporter [Fundicoccus ignavus]
MSSSMASMSGFIVIVFFSSQMMAYFNWSNMGTVVAIKGAELLQNSNGIVLIVGFIIVSAFIDFFIGSASAKWAILAPIFVPMFMLLGYHPAFTQVLYRIGDGFINPSPMQAYIPLVLAVIKRYDKKAGLGTLMCSEPQKLEFI